MQHDYASDRKPCPGLGFTHQTAQLTETGGGYVTESNMGHQLSPRVPAIWGGVPYRNKNFTGRAELLGRIRQDFSENNSVALFGLPGIGKTQIAIEYAHSYMHQYDLVWWIPADQLPSVRGSLASLGSKLGLDAPPAAGIDGLIVALLDALRRGEPYSRWLLIFDHAEDPEEIMDLIPIGPTGNTLITSRDPRWREVVEAAAVTSFTRAESLEFLDKRANKMLEPRDADLLAENLGDLPLALAQGAALLTEQSMSIAQFMRLLADTPSRLLSEGRPPSFHMSMTAAWAMTAARLRERMPAAMELLKCLAFFGPEPVSLRVLRNGTTDSESLTSVLGDPILLGATVRTISLVGAAEVDPFRDTVKVHRVIQALIRDSLTEDECLVFRHQVDLLSTSAASQKSNRGTEWLLMSIYVPFERLYAAEQRRVLTLFRDWLAKTRKHGIRQVERSTSRGAMFEYYADDSVTLPELKAEIDVFSSFLNKCADAPAAAVNMLSETQMSPTAATELVTHFGKEMRRLEVDARHARERGILALKQTLENTLLEADVDLGAVPTAQLDAMLEELVPYPDAATPLPAIEGPSVIRLPANTNVTFHQTIYSAMEQTIIEHVQGTVNLGVQAKQILALIDRFAAPPNAPALVTAIHELEDPDAPADSRRSARAKLRKFVADLSGKVEDATLTILEKYLESKMGL
jgi:hypothetical protein